MDGPGVNAPSQPLAFFTYARAADSQFALQLAADLKKAGVSVWLDQLDIAPGEQWDLQIERALNNCSAVLAVLSPDSVASRNVMDEISFALEEGKTVIPLLVKECRVPFRLRRVQYVDFQLGYEYGFDRVRQVLAATNQQLTVAVAVGAKPEVVDEAEAARKAEEDPIAREQAEAARKADEDRIAREQADAIRKAEENGIAREQAEAARKAEEDRVARKQAEAARKAEEDRIAREQAEAARKAEEDRIARQQAEAAPNAEEERIARQQAEAAPNAEQDRIAREPPKRNRFEGQRIAFRRIAKRVGAAVGTLICASASVWFVSRSIFNLMSIGSTPRTGSS